MRKFIFDKRKRIIIYGAGGNANRVITVFDKSPYEIIAIIDKRANEIYDMGAIPVYTLENFAREHEEREQYIVLITVKNVFEHINIVRNLLDYGYDNIIYKPYAILQGEHDKEWDSINFVYESLIEKGQWSKERFEVAKTRKNHLFVYKDELCIEKKEKISCWLPVELICNYNKEDPFGLIPMAAFYPIVSIYQYLLSIGINDDWEEICEDYLRYSGEWIYRNGKDCTSSLRTSMIHSRVDIFGEMQKKADLDKEFFVRNKVIVERKEGAFFYLTVSGRNRVSFLIAKGYRYIPVEMSSEDYLGWINDIGFQKFKAFVEEKKINKFFTSIPHPMLATFNTQTIDYIHLFCMPVISEIYKYLHKSTSIYSNGYERVVYERFKELYAKIQIGIIMIDDGCMARLLRSYGFNSKRCIINPAQNEISQQIDDLLYLPKETDKQLCISLEEIVVESNILIIDSRIQELPLIHIEGKKIFWLQWNDDELGIYIEKNKQINKKQIFKSVWMKKKVAGWILE